MMKYTEQLYQDWLRLYFYLEHQLHEGEITETTFLSLSEALMALKPRRDEVHKKETVADLAVELAFKEVGEWLTSHAAFTAVVSEGGIQLPFLQLQDYERLYRAFKRGEMPK